MGNISLRSCVDEGFGDLYDYGPQGEIANSWQGADARQPYGFNTKYAQKETGWIYYGLRYLDPQTGRWLNRDPIGERGGKNIYSLCLNDAVNRVDHLGQFSTSVSGLIWRDPTRDEWKKIRTATAEISAMAEAIMKTIDLYVTRRGSNPYTLLDYNIRNIFNFQNGPNEEIWADEESRLRKLRSLLSIMAAYKSYSAFKVECYNPLCSVADAFTDPFPFGKAKMIQLCSHVFGSSKFARPSLTKGRTLC